MAEKVARVIRKDTLTPEVLEIEAEWVSPPEVGFRTGQFLSLRCGDGGDTRRSYSIASLPDDKRRFELLVKLVPVGVGSDLFRGLSVGDELHATGPMGFFVLELAHPGDALFAATGSGIAAALPMIEETLARPAEQGKVLLYWGMRDKAELYWLDRIEKLKHPRFELHICLSRPEADLPLSEPFQRGRITSPVLERVPSLVKPTVYLVGNGDMVRELRNELVAIGLDRRRQIRTEVFYPATTRDGG